MKKTTSCLLLLMLMCICSTFAFGQEKRTVTGTVTDSSGKGVAGVTVTVKGTKTSAISDAQGQFKINVASAGDELLFSSVGYQATEVAAGSGAPLHVTLQSSVGNLGEVVVTALGIKREQRKLGYATTTISSQEILKTAPTNFGSALYGKAPGVVVRSNPGGATSAVSIQIRGINSIGSQGQPLLVVDGVVVRNGDANNEGYWGGNQRINGNGLLDINPENIESLNILKGAAASALYGSDANFGVIVITTKSGRKSNGLGIDVSLSGNVEKVGVVPDLQTEYGPGYDRATNMGSFGADDEGWIHKNVNGQDVVYPIFRAYGQFGPKVDGRQVYWWDGQMRPYVSQKNNWKAFYRDGYSSIANIAINNATDKFNYRFSYTRNDYKGIQIGGKNEKNTFNLNTTYRINPKLNVDLVVNYTNEKTHNRPRQLYYVTNNYGGFFSPVDYMDVYFNKYQTTKGYKWVDWNQTQLDPVEAIKYNVRAKDFLDFLWNQLANSFDETSNRIIASATLNYNIVKGLNFRGRFGTDYTGYYAENKERSTQPLAFGATGSYHTYSNQMPYTYGDLLLTYNNKLAQDLNYSASIGYQARKEVNRYNDVYTVNGLTTENWFTMNASKDPARGSSSRSTMVKDGLFGILNFDYHNYLFLEGTIRQERTSTLFPGNNVFYYPGVSGAFELTNAFNLPAAISYSKLRASYGIVGAPPSLYIANVVYNAGNINGIPALYPKINPYGNSDLKNEEKHESEIGWETRLFKNRLGFDVSYYSNKIVNQIIPLTIPATTGASSILVNVGTLKNYGLEVSLYGKPVKAANFQWDSRLNLSFNRNKVVALMPGLDKMTNANIDNGSLLVVSEVGQPAGDILGYKRRTDANGNYVINSDGYYDINFDDQVRMGNIQPKGVGGFTNTLTYKNFNLSALLDFRWGGQVISQALLYGTGAGLFTNSLYGRDAEHGGLAYYTDKNTGKNIAATGATGPNGEKVYHDGMVLNGVNSDGKPNTTIIDAPNYYLNTFGWGSWPGSGSYSTYEGAVFDNNFIKLREVTLGYTFPARIASKLKAQNMMFSIYGRNLFYLYKTLPNLDPESGVGTNWVSEAISAGSGTAATRSFGASLRVSF